MLYLTILASDNPNDRYFITGNNYSKIMLWDYSDFNKVSQLYNKQVKYNTHGFMFSQDKIIRTSDRVEEHVYMPFSELTDRPTRSAKEHPIIHDLINQNSDTRIPEGITKLIYEYFSHFQPLTPPNLLANVTKLPIQAKPAPAMRIDSDEEVTEKDSDDDNDMNARPLVFNAGNISVVSEGNANLTLFSFQGRQSNPKRPSNPHNDEQSSEKRFKKS